MKTYEMNLTCYTTSLYKYGTFKPEESPDLHVLH